MGNDTSLVIPVAEAAFVQPFRERYQRGAGASMPPHITVRAPFKRMHEFVADDYHTLAALCASFSSFAFHLVRLRRFAENGVLYLGPEPTEPFMTLYRALFARYPVPPDKHPAVVFHLTLARQRAAELDMIETEFDRSYGAFLPIEAAATELSLYEKRDERWFKEAAFPFGQSVVGGSHVAE
jgi:2'-5' RNA ligase